MEKTKAGEAKPKILEISCMLHKKWKQINLTWFSLFSMFKLFTLSESTFAGILSIKKRTERNTQVL